MKQWPNLPGRAKAKRGKTPFSRSQTRPIFGKTEAFVVFCFNN